jgi:cadmium resistance protein CadD (predicted permease)
MSYTSYNRTDDTIGKFFLGFMVLLLVGACLSFIALYNNQDWVIGLLLVLLGIGGSLVLSYIVGNWIINRIEGRR